MPRMMTGGWIPSSSRLEWNLLKPIVEGKVSAVDNFISVRDCEVPQEGQESILIVLSPRGTVAASFAVGKSVENQWNKSGHTKGIVFCVPYGGIGD